MMNYRKLNLTGRGIITVTASILALAFILLFNWFDFIIMDILFMGDNMKDKSMNQDDYKNQIIDEKEQYKNNSNAQE